MSLLGDGQIFDRVRI